MTTKLFILRCLRWGNLVRPSGFEPLAFCSGGKQPRDISQLQGFATIANPCAFSLVIKEFRRFADDALAPARNGSMRRVGTKPGTVGLP